MRTILFSLAFLTLGSMGYAQGAEPLWDDVVSVPAIKEEGILKSCPRQGWRIIANQGKEIEGKYLCSQTGSWGRGGPMMKVTAMTPQEIVNVHVANVYTSKVTAIGMMPSLASRQAGQYASDEESMLLFLKR